MKSKANHAVVATLAIASLATQIQATGLDDLQFWTGTGTNRAALVIHWSPPEVRNNTSVPDPIADKSLAWGFRWNGSATGEQMFKAVLAADPRLFTSINVSAFGTSILGFGYDLNNNRVFGLRHGTNVVAPAGFTNGIVVLPTSSADQSQSLDPGDLYWAGWFGAGWETWHEQAGAGGFTSAPDRGASPYWIPGDPQQPYFGDHGQWHLADLGMSDIQLKDGSWLGFSVGGGGLDFANPTAPGTVAYSFHKQAPASPESAPVGGDPFAVAVVAAKGPFGPAPYDDPASALGAPSRDFYDPFGDFSGGTKERRVKLVEPAFNLDAQLRKLITTLGDASSIVVRFDQPVTNNPANPYGIDFLVFGNSFYSADGFADDTANMSTLKVMGGLFGEAVKVSVSPGFTGLAGEDANNPATWPWYRYNSGPFGDTAFPTQGYLWDRLNAKWSPQPTDFTKPVNPALGARLDAGNLTGADVIDLYAGSGGGTGFDLAATGFASIRYAKVEGISPDWVDGEIDALTVVRPAVVGEALALAPANLTNGTDVLYFQNPANPAASLLALDFQKLGDIASVRTTRAEQGKLAELGSVLAAISIQVTPVIGTNAVTFETDGRISLDAAYSGNGNDLAVLKGDGVNWSAATFTYDAVSGAVLVPGVTNSTTLAVVKVAPPRLAPEIGAIWLNYRFRLVPGWTYTLERTVDFKQWTEIASHRAVNAESTSLSDPGHPDEAAFYRLRLTRP
jgi:hypothetical protein